MRPSVATVGVTVSRPSVTVVSSGSAPTAAGSASAATRALASLRLLQWISILLAVSQQGAARKPDTACRIEIDHHHRDLVPNVHFIFDGRNPVVCQLADVYHAVLAGQKLDEGAEVGRPNYLAGVDLADLHVLCEVSDHLDGLRGSGAVARADDDRPVVLDVHSRARLFHDPANHLAAGPDDSSDLVDRNLDRLHPWRIRAEVGPVRGDCLLDVLQDRLPRFPCLLKGVAHHVVANALHLDV